MSKQTNDIKDQVMAKISSGEVKIRSRNYFMFIGALVAATALVGGLLAAYVVSMSLYWLRIQSSPGSAYGANRNLQEMLTNFPWWTIVLSVVLIIGIVRAVRSYKQYYRFSRLKLAILVTVIIVILGLVLSSVQYPKSLYKGQGNRWGAGNGQHNK